MASIYNPSDASPELVDYIAKHFDEWPAATRCRHLRYIVATIATACQAVSPVTKPIATPRRSQRQIRPRCQHARKTWAFDQRDLTV